MARASGFRMVPDTGPSTSSGEWGERGNRGGWERLGSVSPETSPELKFFMKVAYQKVLPRETHSGVGAEKLSKGPSSREVP